MALTTSGFWYPDTTMPVAPLEALFAAVASALETQYLDAKPSLLYKATGGVGTSASTTPVSILSSGSVILKPGTRLLEIAGGAIIGADAAATARAYLTGTVGTEFRVIQGTATSNVDGGRVAGGRTMHFTASGTATISLMMLRVSGSGTLTAAQGTLSMIDLGPA